MTKTMTGGFDSFN